MSKVIGGVFALLGTMMSIFIGFLYMNSSAYLPYNTKPGSLLDTGLLVPAFFAFVLMAVGYTFLFVSKEPNTN